MSQKIFQQKLVTTMVSGFFIYVKFKRMFKKFFILKLRRRKRSIKSRATKFVRRVRTNSKGDFLTHKDMAYEIVRSRLEYFNQFYNFKYNKITIRNQISRWGSCSKKGNLNFNYRIALLKPELADYIVVHELCHLGEFNHSKNFWDLVEKTLPDWRKLRSELKSINTLVIKP